MSEFTVPRGNRTEAAGRRSRVATIGDVCSLVVRAASTSRAQSARADLTVADVMPRPAGRPTTAAVIDRTARYDAVTAR